MPFLQRSGGCPTSGTNLTQRGRINHTRKTGEHQCNHRMSIGKSKQSTRSDPEQGSQGDIVEPMTPPVHTVPKYGSHYHLAVRTDWYIGPSDLPESQYFHSAGIQPSLRYIPSYSSVRNRHKTHILIISALATEKPPAAPDCKSWVAGSIQKHQGSSHNDSSDNSFRAPPA